MIRNPIRKVLSSMRKHRVRALLMGGQACVFYGAAEFSRDTDFAILADTANLARLRKALAELQAGVIAVPPFELKYLRRGHAVHFRCQHPEAFGMRVDIMSKMRGVETFPKLWGRRTTIEIPDGMKCDLLSLQCKPSEVVRLAVVEFLKIDDQPAERPAERVRDLIGSIRSGTPDLALRHREYLVKKLRRGR